MKIVIALLSMLMLTSCCKDGVETARYLISDEEKEFNPYSIGDITHFKHSKGSRVTFKVEGINTELRFSETEHCGDNFYAYEELLILLTGDIGFDINITIQPVEFSDRLNIRIGNTDLIALTSSLPDFDSLDINGTIYKDVYLVESGEENPKTILPQSLIFNKEYGIIQFKMTNDETYTIDH